MDNFLGLVFLIVVATVAGYILWLIVPWLVYIWLGLDAACFIVAVVCYFRGTEFMDAPDGA